MIQIRSCIACKRKTNKKELIRIVYKDNRVVFDKLQKENKRAFYVCNDIKCIRKLIKCIEKNKLKLKQEMDYDKLKEFLNNIISELGE